MGIGGFEEVKCLGSLDRHRPPTDRRPTGGGDCGRLPRAVSGTLAACQNDLNLPSDRTGNRPTSITERALPTARLSGHPRAARRSFRRTAGLSGFRLDGRRKGDVLQVSRFSGCLRQCRLREGAAGCARGRSVSSTVGLDTYTLVHAYLAGVGDPPPILIEGVAVVVSCEADYYATPKPTQTWAELATVTFGASDTVTVYATGAWLVGYLLDAFGPQPFLTLYRTLPARGGRGRDGRCRSDHLRPKPVGDLDRRAERKSAAQQAAYGSARSRQSRSTAWRSILPRACAASTTYAHSRCRPRRQSRFAAGALFGLGPCGRTNPQTTS